jgi:hypothetical protein
MQPIFGSTWYLEKKKKRLVACIRKEKGKDRDEKE